MRSTPGVQRNDLVRVASSSMILLALHSDKESPAARRVCLAALDLTSLVR